MARRNEAGGGMRPDYSAQDVDLTAERHNPAGQDADNVLHEVGADPREARRGLTAPPHGQRSALTAGRNDITLPFGNFQHNSTHKLHGEAERSGKSLRGDVAAAVSPVSQYGGIGVGHQIKNRDRVRDLAEVYTHEREVNAMLDLVPDMFPSEENPGNHDRTFLEPACGSGNFLEEILRRKLSTVTTNRYGLGERYEHRILRCLASIYGIDIDEENVRESRDRLRAVIVSHLDNDLNTQGPTEGLTTAVEVILGTNIIQADTLKDAKSIRIVAYQPGLTGTFTREWSFLEDAQLDLFDETPAEPARDALSIHYRELAVNPGPTHASRTAERERTK